MRWAFSTNFCQTELCVSKAKTSLRESAKDQLTGAICTNMAGTEKLSLPVTGKSKNPRGFTNVKSLPVEYKANKRAWMTGKLFE